MSSIKDGQVFMHIDFSTQSLSRHIHIIFKFQSRAKSKLRERFPQYLRARALCQCIAHLLQIYEFTFMKLCQTSQILPYLVISGVDRMCFSRGSLSSVILLGFIIMETRLAFSHNVINHGRLQDYASFLLRNYHFKDTPLFSFFPFFLCYPRYQVDKNRGNSKKQKQCMQLQVLFGLLLISPEFFMSVIFFTKLLVQFKREQLRERNNMNQKMKGQSQGERDQKNDMISFGQEKSLEYRVLILEKMLQEKVRKIDQLDAAVHILNVAMRRTDEENQQMKRKMDKMNTDTLRLPKRFEESTKQMQTNIQEQLEKTRNSLSEEIGRAQNEIEKKIPEAKNEELEKVINELWQQLQATNNKIIEIIEVEKQKISMLPALPRKRHKRQICRSRNASVERSESPQLQVIDNEINNKITKFIEKEKQKTATIHKKQNVQVDLTTPFIDQFLIEGNKITYKGNKSKHHQILLDTWIRKSVPFVFVVQILHSRGGFITIGVVDRLAEQKLQCTSGRSGNFVGYCCRNGIIYYGNNGQYDANQTGETLSEGMKLRVEVNLRREFVRFTLIKGEEEQEFTQTSDILSQLDRKFVPAIEMYYPGESIRWFVE